MRAEGHGASDAGDVLLEPFFFWSTVPGWGRIARHKFLADSDFPFVGQAREAHRNAGEVALGVGSHIQDGVGRDGTGLGAALAPIQPGDREAQDEKENNEDDGALHRNWRMASWYFAHKNETNETTTPTMITVIYLSRVCRPQTSRAKTFATHSKRIPIPVRRKLRSLVASPSTKITTPSIPHDTVTIPERIFKASMKVTRMMGAKNTTCSGRLAITASGVIQRFTFCGLL